jgi:DNA polymerase-3 subunit alpha
VGCLLSVELDEASGPLGPATREKPPRLPLLVQNEVGYQNLSKLLSQSYLGMGAGEWPHVRIADLARNSEGLIALTGGPGGPLNRLIVDGYPQVADRLLKSLAAIFPSRLYVELQRHGLSEERAAEDGLIERAYAMGLPLVATNDVHFGPEEMYEAHDALLCIADGAFVSQTERRKLTREHRFKTAAEMAAQFADLPEAIDNTIEIARRCAFRPKNREPILPKIIPESGLSPADELRAQAEAGLAHRLAAHVAFADERVYRDRLQYELDVIIRMDFPGYFLIVSDFMKWTRQQGIPVGVRAPVRRRLWLGLSISPISTRSDSACCLNGS